MSPKIEVVWVDFGGVLSPPYSDLFKRFESRTRISRVQLESSAYLVARAYGMAPLAPLELAVISQEEWGERMQEHLLRRFPDGDLATAALRDFGRVWFEGAEPNRPLAEALDALRHEQEVSVGLVTNNVIEWEPHWRAMLADGPRLDYVVDSCRIGVRKPDEAFFRAACEIAGVDPTACLLIDDSHENCRAATKLGWTAVHYRDNAQAIAAIRSLVSKE